MAQTEIQDQAQFPWRTVVYIEATFPDGQVFTGSGVMVGPNDVLTASHVLYNSSRGGAATTVTVTPAFDPSPLETPYGTLFASSIRYFTDFDPDGDGFIFDGDLGPALAGSELDVALIDLGTPVGDLTGWMGLDPDFVSGVVNVTGFPTVYGYNLMNDSGPALDSATDWVTYFGGIEVRSGDSGGPVWYASNGTPYVVGVVSTSGWAADIAGTYSAILGWMNDNDGLIANANRSVAGGAGNDSIRTGYGTDEILGGAGDDLLDAGAGNDTLTGGAGTDTLDGGGGLDFAVFTGSRAQYAVVQTGAGWTVQDTVDARDGADVLQAIERLQFGDLALALDTAGNAGNAYALWNAAFDRTPALTEIGGWIAPFDEGRSMVEVAQEFIASYAPAISNEDVVRVLYTNVVGRPPGSLEMDFYRGILDRGETTQAGLFVFAAQTDLNRADYVELIAGGIGYTPWVT